MVKHPDRRKLCQLFLFNDIIVFAKPHSREADLIESSEHSFDVTPSDSFDNVPTPPRIGLMASDIERRPEKELPSLVINKTKGDREVIEVGHAGDDAGGQEASNGTSGTSTGSGGSSMFQRLLQQELPNYNNFSLEFMLQLDVNDCTVADEGQGDDEAELSEEDSISSPLLMHTGGNSTTVVGGQLDPKKYRYGLRFKGPECEFRLLLPDLHAKEKWLEEIRRASRLPTRSHPL